MSTDPETYMRCVDFLNEEAELLDSWELWEWFDRLTDDIRYFAPVRETRERRNNEFSDSSHHFLDDKESIELRIKKMEHEYSWSHIPPVRDRRLVSNIRVLDESNQKVTVESKLLLRIGERDKPGAADEISCKRTDLVRKGNGQLKLAEREILFDETAFGSPIVLFV